MRLGLVIYGGLQTRSGGYLFDRKLVEYMEGQGDRIEVLSLPRRNYLRHLGDNLSRSLAQKLIHADYDFLLQDELNHPSLFLLNRLLRQKVGYGLIAIVHHLRSSELNRSWQNHIYRLLERLFLESVEAFIFNTRSTQGVVEALVGSQRPAVVAHPGRDHLQPKVSEGEIITRAQESGPLRILFVGNLIPRKGLHTLIDALERLPLDEWRLTVIGSLAVDRSYAASIHRRLRQDGLEGNIQIMGSQSSDEVARCLTRSQLLVVPSTYEGFGIVYLEAQGFGLPSIATARGGASEVVEDGRTGFLVPSGDPITLAERSLSLMRDRQRLAQMGLAARQNYHAHPTWAESGERVRDFLRGLMER